MGEYRVYRVGEPGVVRVARRPEVPAPIVPPRARAARPGARRSRLAGLARGLGLAAAAALVAAAAWMAWRAVGRDVVANADAALALARLSGRLPGWSYVAAPAALVALLAGVTALLASRRHLALRAAGLLVVAAVLAAPGFALGYANGLVGAVGGRSEDVRQVVEETRRQLRPELPGQPLNILLIGADHSERVPDDPGRSDTQLLVRLDPATKTISMLSLPRDLRVYIPGVGYNKMNAAYTYGGPALAVRTFSEVTGLPINHFIEVDFSGFWHIVNLLGGVYVPVDRRYYNPESSSYKSIDIEPGYQLLDGHDALDFVRFRHDQYGDFNRMRRQQLFLRELQRQSGRWSSDWRRVVRLIRAVTRETKSDLDSLQRLKRLVELAFEVDTSRVYQTHLEGDTPTIDGVSYVVASEAQVAEAVQHFLHPERAPVAPGRREARITKAMFTVRVYNGSGVAGLGTAAAQQLAALGYRAEAVGDAFEFPGTVTAVYAPPDLEAQAQAVADLLQPAEVRVVGRGPLAVDGLTVYVASSFDGTVAPPAGDESPAQVLLDGQDYEADAWAQWDLETPVRLERPRAWVPGFVYEQFRAYKVPTTDGRQRAAAVAVVRTPAGGYWTIQAMRWLDPPAVARPTTVKRVGGRRLLLFYQGSRLERVAWKRHGTLYWVQNTLDLELSNEVMLGLAASFTPAR